MTLRIGAVAGKAYTLPAEAVTQTFGILAKRGVGKTYTASVLGEELVGAGYQVVILDPLDAWWGLRSSADGKSAGLPVYVFGGAHGDLPLDAAAGALIADVVVEQNISLVLSLRHLSKSAQRKFVTDFAERLYHRKGEDKHRTPLHLIIDEADAFAPQRVMSDTARMLGAIDDCVRRGRSSGIGVTLITQRAASLNKDVLTQCEVLIALRTIAPQDRKAIDDWIEAHDSEGRRAEFMASLASLDVGEAWVWSPGWLDVFDRVRIRKRHTFDSSATPKVGDKLVAPKKRADVDLDLLRDRMASVVKEQEANDPKKLRAQIATLERELAKAKMSATPAVCEHGIEIAELEETIALMERKAAERERDLAEFRDAIEQLLSQGPRPTTMERTPRRGSASAARAGGNAGVARRESTGARNSGNAGPVTSPLPSRPSNNGSAPAGDLTGPERRVLDAIAWWNAIGVSAPVTRNVGTIAGYRVKKKVGGHFGNVLSALRTRGLIDYPTPGTARLTDAGHATAQPPDAMPTTEALHAAVFEQLDGPERRVLQVLIAAYPASLQKQDVGAQAGYEVGAKVGGHFGNILSSLRSLGLIDYPTPGTAAASELLFPEGA